MTACRKIGAAVALIPRALFFLLIRRPPRSTLFPYPPLFRARRWFEVSLGAREVRERIAAWLAWLPGGERAYLRAVADTVTGPHTLRLLALSLDKAGQPIPVMNTDPASLVFVAAQDAEAAAAWTEPLLRPFPVGLFVPDLGVLAANDAYATRDVWDAFRADPYHSPCVVWGREVNLLLLGLARSMHRTGDATAGRAAELRQALERVRAAAE